ncbi:chymotrypsin-2-like [Contarinia nasturtii]|uniref:chymotrypsin-2-like n=1 Tax=Contarinia nasturtii TaxID=265458 RepID=UPI0012D3ED74|nr:chymotrypsin-2-like [Contarinia nasturtii]
MKPIWCILCYVIHLISANKSMLSHGSAFRIAGGTEAVEGQAPYQCSMQKYGTHFCNCAIISDEFVLSAAHCIGNKQPKNVDIVMGTNGRNGTVFKAKRFIKHDKYRTSPSLMYDIGLVEVQGTIQFNDKIQAIKYAQRDTQVPDGTTLLVSGWGWLGSFITPPNRLHVLYVTAISYQQCKESWPKVHEGCLCTMNKIGEGTCYGDSGGPMVWGDTLVGLVSYGEPCATELETCIFRTLHFWTRED